MTTVIIKKFNRLKELVSQLLCDGFCGLDEESEICNLLVDISMWLESLDPRDRLVNEGDPPSNETIERTLEDRKKAAENLFLKFITQEGRGLNIASSGDLPAVIIFKLLSQLTLKFY